MNTSTKSTKQNQGSSDPGDIVSRSKAAAKLMAKNLRAEHKRWNMPLLSWKDGKIISTKP